MGTRDWGWEMWKGIEIESTPSPRRWQYNLTGHPPYSWLGQAYSPLGHPPLTLNALTSSLSMIWSPISSRRRFWIAPHFYSGEDKTSVESLGGDFSINNAFNPRNLGANWKLLISRFQNSSWMFDLELNWPSYDRETKPNFSLKFMFLSYSYRFRSIDLFETFCNSS